MSDMADNQVPGRGADDFMVRMNFVSKVFPGDGGEPLHEALKDVSLDIRRGEILALIGRNGAGKSTLAKVLSSIYLHDGGLIESNARRVALAMLDPRSLHLRLTALENLYFFGALYGMSRVEVDGKLAELGRHFDLRRILTIRIDHCSLGMRHLVCLLRSLLPGADLLILDEPSRGLDPVCSRQLLDYVKHYTDDVGKSVLYISHRMEEIEELADRVALIDDGELLFCGAPAELLENFDIPGQLRVNYTGDNAVLRAAISSLGRETHSDDKFQSIEVDSEINDLEMVFSRLEDYDLANVSGMILRRYYFEGGECFNDGRRATASSIGRLDPVYLKPRDAVPRPGYCFLAAAVSRRDFKIAMTYRMSLVVSIVKMMLVVFFLFLVGGMIRQRETSALDAGYFLMAMLGFIALISQRTGVNSLPRVITSAQQMGLMEFLPSTPAGLGRIMGLESFTAVLRSMCQALGLLIFLLFIIPDLKVTPFIWILLAMAISVLLHYSVGFIRAAFFVRFQRGDPVGMMLSWATMLLSGAFIPLDKLPDFVKPLSEILPSTHIVKIMHSGFIRWHKTLFSRNLTVILLLVLIPVCLGISGWIYRMAISAIRRNGLINSR